MKKISIFYLVFALVLAVGLSGCGVISKLIQSDPIKEMILATPAGTLERLEPTEVVQATDFPPVDTLLFSDDFSDPDSGWDILDDEYGTTNYVDGTYQIVAIQKSNYNWGVAGQYFSDVIIDVDVDILDDNAETEDGFGVDCRIQENGDGYGFRIDTKGNIAIELFYEDETTELVDWEYNDAVYTDGRTNHLTAICNGAELTLLVNDVEVASTTDYTFFSGDIALSVYSGSADPITAAFDNLTVHSATIADVNVPAASGGFELEVNNESDFTICGLFIVPSEEEFWSDDLLEDGESIAPGESRVFSGLPQSSVDVRAETCDFFTVNEGYEVDLNSTTSYDLAGPRQLLHQPFDNADGWPNGVVEGGMVSNSNGEVYSVTVTEAEKLVTVSSDFSGQDLILFAKASMVKAGADDMGMYGLTCRMQPNGNGVFFAIRGDGLASIIAINGGEMEQLTEWTASEFIDAGVGENNIEADCLDSYFTMFVNGDYVAYVEDTRYQSGKVGVEVFSPAGESTQADFDFIDVYAGE